MEIASRESQLLITIKYFNECIKTIRIWKFYADDTKKPVSRLKTVEFRNPDGTIDEDRADSSKLLIDKSDKSETGYEEIEIEMLKTINYNDNSTKTIKIWKIHFHGFLGESCLKYKKVEFRNRNGTINKNRSYDSNPFNERERKHVLEILTNTPYGYDAFASEYSKLLKKYDQYNGFQLCLPNNLNI